MQLLMVSMLINCKKKEAETSSKNTITYGGVTKDFDILAAETQFINLDCMSYNSMGGIIYIKSPGIRLNFYNNDVQLVLDLFGESAGKFSKVTAFCNEYQFKNSSLVRSRDGQYVELISGDSELEITKKSNSTISGNFRLRVKPDPNFINDSIIVGQFENIVLREKI